MNILSSDDRFVAGYIFFVFVGGCPAVGGDAKSNANGTCIITRSNCIKIDNSCSSAHNTPAEMCDDDVIRSKRRYAQCITMIGGI